MRVTIENLKTEIAKSFRGNLEDIESKTNIAEILDSLDMLDFFLNIEDTYKITIPDDDLLKLKTLEDYVNYINENI